MKVVFYLRVSSNKQDERTQLDMCLKFVRNSGKLGQDFQYQVYTDTISTRKHMSKRPGLQAALMALESGDYFIGQKIDRVSRKLSEAVVFVDDLEKRGVKWIFTDQPGLHNAVLLGMYAGFAEEEVKLIRTRIKDKLDAKKSRNERTTYQIPYGFTIHPEHLITVKRRDGDGFELKKGLLIEYAPEQKALHEMIVMFQMGYPYRMISACLADKGYFNRKGRPFDHTAINRILARIGYSRSRGKLLQKEEFALSH